jgi:hypothetical protein
MNIQILLEVGHKQDMEYEHTHNTKLIHAQISILQLFKMIMLLYPEG